MKRILMLAALALVVLPIAALSSPVENYVTKTLEIGTPFACLIDKPVADYVFDPVAESPDGDSSGEAECGMFWSNLLDWNLYANADSCFTLTISPFKLTVNGTDYYLASALDCVGGTTREWWESWFIWHELDGGTVTEQLQVGVERSGFGDHAGTYLATIEVSCESCVHP